MLDDPTTRNVLAGLRDPCGGTMSLRRSVSANAAAIREVDRVEAIRERERRLAVARAMRAREREDA